MIGLSLHFSENTIKKFLDLFYDYNFINSPVG